MGRRKLTRILLSAGSSWQTANLQQETARDICVRKRLTEILEILDGPPVPLVNYGNKGSGAAAAIAADGVDGRDRSSSSSRHRPSTKDGATKSRRHESSAPTKRDRTDSAEPKTPKTTANIAPPTPATPADQHLPANPKNWSPYGCHYFPDPKSFPSPKLKTLPKEPLATGEQYYLDLAGNIRKGPVGVGNTCYCGPFFRHIEERISENRKSIKKLVHRATEKIDHKVQALASKTDDQIEQIARKIAAERRHCDGQREHLERWLRRGDRTRSTTVAAHTSKSRKDETNTNTLTRCRSLELLDGGGGDLLGCNGDGERMTGGAMSRSFGLLNTICLRADVHADGAGGERTEHDVEEEDDDDRTLHRLYFLDSDKEWQYHGSSGPNDTRSDQALSASRSHHRSASASEKERFSRGAGSGGTGGDSSAMGRRSGISARLEELLSKTNEIIELERSARRKSAAQLEAYAGSSGADERLLLQQTAPAALLHVRKSSKYGARGSTSRSSGGGGGGGGTSTALSGEHSGYEDSLVAASRSQRNQLRRRSAAPSGTGEHDASFQIAKEMEKITASLLGTNVSRDGRDRDRDRDRNVHHHLLNRHHQQLTGVSSNGSDDPNGQLSSSPVSPEIAKEYISRKERRAALEKEQESSSLISSHGSQRSIYMPAFASQEAREIMRMQHMQQQQQQHQLHNGSAGQQRSVVSDDGGPSPAGGFGAFYQNTCFDDVGGDAETPDEHDDDGEQIESGSVMESSADADEHCELSEMANIRQLNELKSRILNGAHWMRQQQQQSRKQTTDGNQPEEEQPLDTEATAADAETSGILSSVSNLGKVRELVAMIQGSKNFEEACALEFDGAHANGDEDEDSESSDDDADVNEGDDNEDDDTVGNEHDKVASKPAVMAFGAMYSNPSNYMEYSHEIDKQLPVYAPSARPKPIVDIGDASVASDQPPPIKFSSYPTNTAPAPLLDTRYLIPKDAYFHELPGRPRPKAIAAGDYAVYAPQTHNTIEPSYQQPMYQYQHQQIQPPQPQPQPHHHLAEPPQSMLVSTLPIYYQSHQMPVAPQRERLLTNRKFSAIPAALPLPAVRSMMLLPADDIVTAGAAATNGNHVDTTASNDSGYSARVGSQAASASPSLSGQSLNVVQTACDDDGVDGRFDILAADSMVENVYDSRRLPARPTSMATMTTTTTADIGSFVAGAGAADGGGGYESYYLGNIGASSLV